MHSSPTVYCHRRWVRRKAVLFVACHLLLSSITVRNKGTIIAVVEAAERAGGKPDPRDTKGYYQALNIERDADQKKIKSAYRKLALKYHVSIFHSFLPIVHFRIL